MEKQNYSKLRERFKEYCNKYSSVLTNEKKDYAEELGNKLLELEDSEAEIAELIEKLSKRQDGIHFDPETETIHFAGMKIKVQRADPNVPIRSDNVTTAYTKNTRIGVSEEDQKNERRLERVTSSFYYTVARVRVIARKYLPGLSNFECEGARNVRNHLLEHPEGSDSGITLDSFSYSKNEGPFVKGVRQGNQTRLMEKGFVHNSKEFVDNLIQVLEKNL